MEILGMTVQIMMPLIAVALALQMMPVLWRWR